MATISIFKPRTTKPSAGNKYYIRSVSGGYNGAVQGNPTDKECNVLSNCVGYANGRFNEIIGENRCKFQLVCNAENFIESAKQQGLSVGQAPKLGAIMVWQKGGSLSGADGAGHVCVVEEVISASKVKTSESGWGGSAFWNGTREKGSNGNWGQPTSYKFRGFIYNPAVPDGVKIAAETYKMVNTKARYLKQGDSGPVVRAVMLALKDAGHYEGAIASNDMSFGPLMKAAVKSYQKANGLSVDGEWGVECWTSFLSK